MKIKRLVALFLSAVAVCSSAAFTGCKPQDNSGDNDNTDSNQGNEYSQILKTVLESEYYNGLIETSMQEKAAIFFNDPNFKSIPYTFLQQNGHNIENIKNRTLSCETDIYYKENDTNHLYLSVHVENNDTSITDYVLKYALTNREFNDFKMIFEKDYIQAPLMIQELSKQKTAQVESKITLTKKAYGIAKEYFTDEFYKNLLNCETVNFDIINLSVETMQLTTYIRGKSHKEQTLLETSILDGTLRAFCFLTESNYVYNFDKINFKTSNDNQGQTIYYLGLSTGYTTDNYKNLISK